MKDEPRSRRARRNDLEVTRVYELGPDSEDRIRRAISMNGSRLVPWPLGSSTLTNGLSAKIPIEDYRRHVAKGCFVFVGMPTRTADGAAILELWGPWP